jgi:hypothetical protein|nr:MAG TPA: hypothetical protein [Caudoviricetes sp.]
MIKEEAKYLLPIMQAFVEGKVIECRAKLNRIKGVVDIPNKWTETNEIWCVNSLEYRIKPEQEPKYRPFKDEKECWQEMQKHQPVGWVKDNDCHYDIVSVSNRDVSIVNLTGDIIILRFSDAMEDYTFVDGTPFGILEEE